MRRARISLFFVTDFHLFVLISGLLLGCSLELCESSRLIELKVESYA